MNYIVTVLLGILVGILITVPLGPTSIYVAQRTLQGDTRKGLLVAVGAVIVDVFYCLVITMGLIALVNPYMQNAVVQIVFSVFLIGYGVKMLFFERKKLGADGEDETEAVIGADGNDVDEDIVIPVVRSRFFQQSHYKGVLIGISMTLANPTLFFSWVAVLSFVSAHGLLTDSFSHKLLFSFAVGVGSMAWFLSLALFVRSRRHIISAGFVRTVSVITALVIIGFGVYFTVTIFQHLNGAT
ncbi:MAG: LysE family transporter [Bacteroidetes bacterium]|nr:LysE family transporter [Bacteroidota bacterium]